MKPKIVGSLCAAALVAGIGAASAAPLLQPGRWQVSTQVWLDGKPFTPGGKPIADQTECVSQAESRLSAKDWLRQAVQSVHQPPWRCSFARETADDAAGATFEFRCNTAAGARTEGRAHFEIGDRRYRVEMTSRGHVTDDDTGKPLSAQLVDGRTVTSGRWKRAACAPQ